MNRFIIGRFGVVSLLAALFAAGCAFEQTGDDSDEQIETDDGSQLTGGGGGADEANGARRLPVKQGSLTPKKADESCVGCGPVPDPWASGPVPDPWTSSSGGSNSSSGGSNGGSNSSSGGSNSSSGKP
ncbi:MAG: hypothetical protein KF764_04560 [Labilithrix sp.]|nr:hypothetical protein [Labilithrix sp.]MBX3223177.1 hypothetical protein [Labilithrix sp.]